MKALVTGAAGFIGSRVMADLASRGDSVVGIDNLNSHYDVRLKYGRLRQAGIDIPGDDAHYGSEYRAVSADCRFMRMDIDDKAAIDALFEAERFDIVVNLAAQAGVRYSITNPYAYLKSNLIGFLNILEACRNYKVDKLVYASSSSVYGLNSKVPYSESDITDSPVSLYAATKKADELMAHAYSKLYGIQAIGLRYFTVYGPWGRPDMSPMLFASAISKGEPIKVFNHGDMLRDFTYIDDIVAGTLKVIDHHIEPDSNGVAARVFNIGCSNPVRLMDFIHEIETALGTEAKKEFLPMQPGDVYQTNADTTRLEHEINYKPSVRLHEGIARFIEWYKSGLNPLK